MLVLGCRRPRPIMYPPNERRFDPACEATSAAELSAARRDSLPPDDSRWNPNRSAAEWARAVPGGFAGMYGDPFHSSQFVVMLQDTTITLESIRALEQRLSAFYRRPIMLTLARRRVARWNSAQLYDWYRFLMPRAMRPPYATSAAIDIIQNRLRFGISTDSSADALAAYLRSLAVPCGLVEIAIEPPAVAGMGFIPRPKR